ncbi:polyhydroxyalkanoate synthesis regulator DNA-binding domain-containing protein [Polynucleobacter sp. MWH-Aus1W21]|uniref:polyhydroxyalkanoate synthesis regulator DNA-binding domain-containing protein n=1 Tax=Polynucleobacter sp. MWH-Aus1W21 TaxID=1855880 RepID=UPI001BFD086C|nr:polyhydroxyalkanoate synthesis regulator DNA-binding domain-containing protein [Polynucleobacter sp. MWH-Aus1W21]QWD66017.1 hypothetical protein ICW03_10285 [Polynucleobacter sp. MWH-Aus1W21]
MANIVHYVKYPNRRIYDKNASCYVPFSSIRKKIIEGNEIVILDNTTKEDVTREVLISIILEEGIAGNEIFSVELMKMIIKLYDNPLKDFYVNGLNQSQSFLTSLLSNFSNKEKSEK